MKREFLEGLGLTEKATIDRILDENSRDIGHEKQRTMDAMDECRSIKEQLEKKTEEYNVLKGNTEDVSSIQKQLEELQRKYETETKQYLAQISERDYSDAINRAITSKGLKFSSKSAERAFIADLKDKKLELKDGELQDFDGFIDSQKKADPDAFASEKAAPRFSSKVGMGGDPPVKTSRAAQIAAEYNRNLYGTPKGE